MFRASTPVGSIKGWFTSGGEARAQKPGQSSELSVETGAKLFLLCNPGDLPPRPKEQDGMFEKLVIIGSESCSQAGRRYFGKFVKAAEANEANHFYATGPDCDFLRKTADTNTTYHGPMLRLLYEEWRADPSFDPLVLPDCLRDDRGRFDWGGSGGVVRSLDDELRDLGTRHTRLLASHFRHLLPPPDAAAPPVAVEHKENSFIYRFDLYRKLTPAVRSSIGLPPNITADTDPRFGSQHAICGPCWAKIDASLQQLFPREQYPPPAAFDKHCPGALYPSFADGMKRKAYAGEKQLGNKPVLVGFGWRPSASEAAAAALATLGGAAGSS